MNDPLFESLKLFLDENKERPLLLGYSGGPDSKVLLYLLYRYKKTYGLDFDLAHVDHKWRESSTKEALELKEEAQMLGLRFHLRTIERSEQKTNIENFYRELRIQFFEELSYSWGYKALLLAHHKDDLSETVLKRILEGADFSTLVGMKKISQLNNLMVWRPLLDFSKSEINYWLEKNDLVAIDDITNRDDKYLRARIRQKIIPTLSASFGKEISENLVRVSCRSSELKDYLDKRTNKWFETRIDSPFGSFIEFGEEDLEILELKHLIKRMAKILSLDLSRDVIERTSLALKQRNNFYLVLKGGEIRVHSNCLFVITKLDLGSYENKAILKEGKNFFGRWEIELEKILNLPDKIKNYDWKDAWKGEFEAVLPLYTYEISLPSPALAYGNKRLSKWFSENRVPSFLRFSFPVIFKEDTMFYEFLSGKKRFKDHFPGSYCKLSFKLSH
jgi:tRNA(Ile)-lysidine synthase